MSPTLVTAALLAWISTSQANYVNADYCFEIQNLSFIDGATGDYLTGTTWDAKGLKVYFVDDHNPAEVKELFADSSGPDAGCVTAYLNDSRTYTVGIYYKAKLNGNTVSVHNENGALYRKGVAWQVAHTGGTTTDISINATRKMHPLVAMSHAINRRNGGMTNQHYKYWVDPDYDGVAAWKSNHIVGHPDYATRKFVTAHEMGHAVSDFADEGNGFRKNYKGGMGPCSAAYDQDSHRMTSKEHQSAAAVEGIAHYYSAVVFNNDGAGAACDMENHGKFDWDADGVINGDENDKTYSCSANFMINGDWIYATDYLHDRCMGSGPTRHRGTEFDWLRMFWDLNTQEGWTVGDVMRVWDQANPSTWNATHTGDSWNDVAHRMQQGADNVGLGAAYARQAAINGTDD